MDSEYVNKLAKIDNGKKVSSSLSRLVSKNRRCKRNGNKKFQRNGSCISAYDYKIEMTQED